MIDALHHFLLIAEHHTFTRAARRAHLSQPALTASIQKLEQDLGAVLFHRGRTGAQLTAAGQALLPRARAVLSALDEARRTVRETTDLTAGEVRLGAGATACTYLLPPLLSSFRAAHPGVRFRLREATTPDVLFALETGEIDLGLVTHSKGDLWHTDELILIAAPSVLKSNTFKTAPTRAKNTKGQGEPEKLPPFITFGKGSTTRKFVDDYFPSANIVMELGSIAAVKANVRAGIGIALLSRSAVENDLAQGRLAEFPHQKTPIARPLRLLHRGQTRLPPAAAAFREWILRSPPAPPKKSATTTQTSPQKKRR